MFLQIPTMIVFKHLKNSFHFLLSLKFRSFLQLISGFYTEWSPRKDLILAEKIYCIIFHLIIMLTFFIKFIFNVSAAFSRELYALPIIVEYFCCVIITFISRGLNCHRFYSDLRTIDKTMGVKIPSTTIIASALLLVLSTAYVLLVCSLLDSSEASSGQLFTISMIMWYLFLYQTHKTVLFEMFWKRMRVIRLQLRSEMNSSDKNRKIKNITKWLLVFKNLLVSVERIIGAVKLSFIFAITFATFQNFLEIIKLINILKEGYQTTIRVVAMGTVLRLSMTICVLIPALLAEMVLYEYHEIKGLLATNLLYCSAKDQELRSVIHKSLDYLDSRAPRYNIWRIFQLDINLPITFFNICITFLILALQFNKG